MHGSAIMNRQSLLFLFAIIGLVLTGRLEAGDSKPVSYYADLVPIFKRSCTGCHHPGKLKGELDLTSYGAFQKGGKHGPSFKAGDLAASLILEEIGGAEPSMPKEGDPLAKAE